jgi:hypothetical protein
MTHFDQEHTGFLELDLREEIIMFELLNRTISVSLIIYLVSFFSETPLKSLVK